MDEYRVDGLSAGGEEDVYVYHNSYYPGPVIPRRLRPIRRPTKQRQQPLPLHPNLPSHLPHQHNHLT